jgi:hypothetical protein
MKTSHEITERIRSLVSEQHGAMPEVVRQAYLSARQQTLASLEIALQIALLRETFEKYQKIDRGTIDI